MTAEGDGLYHTSTLTSSSPNAPEFDTLCEAAIQTFGPCSLTVLAWLPDRGVLKRIWTANKAMFPNDAEHSIPSSHPLMTKVIKGQQSLYVRSAAEVRATYVAYETIFKSGDTCIVNIPVIERSGDTVGSLNFGTIEGRWTDSTVEEMMRVVNETAPEAFSKWASHVATGSS